MSAAANRIAGEIERYLEHMAFAKGRKPDLIHVTRKQYTTVVSAKDKPPNINEDFTLFDGVPVKIIG